MQKSPLSSKEQANSSRSSTGHRSRIIDNPLLQSTVDQPWIPAKAARDTVPVHETVNVPPPAPQAEEPVEPEVQEEPVVNEKTGVQEEQSEVSEMVSELHRELSVTLGMTDCQQEELRLLKDKLIKAQENVSGFDSKLQELKHMLQYQEEEVERRESSSGIERFEAQAMSRFFKEGFALRDAEIEELKGKLDQLSQEVASRDARIAEIEEHKSRLSDQLVDSRIELDRVARELEQVSVEKQQCVEELTRVKAGVAEIRAMLTGRVPRAR